MDLFGPRPERPEICDTLAQKIDGYFRRVSVKPGVTGLSQINLPPDEEFEDARRKQIIDLRYIEEANAWLEFRILVATAMRMLGIKGETVMKSMRLCRRHLVRSDHVSSREKDAPLAERERLLPRSTVDIRLFPESDSSAVL